jgi:radical SAM superfamily enzyme YgiQ (UPF0313 family)
LGTVLREQGHEVCLYDLCLYDKDYLETGVLSEEPDVLGISCNTSQYPEAARIASVAKSHSPNTVIVSGGRHPTFEDEECLRESDFDVVVRGEGEYILTELVEALEANSDLSSVNGISYTFNGDVIRKPNKALIKDLDELPAPDLDLLPMDKYKGMELSIETSRGCPYSCIFCSEFAFWERGVWRAKGPERVLRELESLKGDYDMDEFFIVDANFAVNKDRVKKLSSLLINAEMNLKWDADVRIDCLDYETAKAMKDSGCRSIYFGSEAFSDYSLQQLSKGFKVSDIRKMKEMCEELGIEVLLTKMIGLPWDTRDSILAELDEIIDIRPDILELSLLTPLPGTVFHHYPEQFGIEIVEEDLSKHDYAHPVIRTRNLSPEDQSELLETYIKTLESENIGISF